MQSSHKMPLKNQSLPPAETNNSTTSNADDDFNSVDRVTFRGGAGNNQLQDSSVNSTNELESNANISVDEDSPIIQPIVPIHSKTKNWYLI